VKARARTIAGLLWPAFVGAGVVQALVFAHVDAEALHSASGGPLAISAQAVQSLAFLAFWAIVAGSSAVTLWLTRPDCDASSGDGRVGPESRP
jgi:hypothetical protein